MSGDLRTRPKNRLSAATPYLLLVAVATPLCAILYPAMTAAADGEAITWSRPWAMLLVAGCVLAAWAGFHLRRSRAPSVSFSRVAELAATRPGVVARLASLPAVLRVVALAALAVALARPETFRVQDLEVEGIDIALVFDLSKSMEERDLAPNRLAAGQETVRDFIAGRDADRMGLVVFAQQAMLQCPLTLDYRALDQIVAELAIGDVPEMGTAIGDALALALAYLRRSNDGSADADPAPDSPAGNPVDRTAGPSRSIDRTRGPVDRARSRVVVLLSDGDANWTTQFSPREAKDLAVAMGVKVFTILLGSEAEGRPGDARYAVNPALLAEIARDTGGRFFRAGDSEALRESFDEVRSELEKTRRRITGRVAGARLHSWLVVAALVLLLLELALRVTRWRRFP